MARASILALFLALCWSGCSRPVDRAASLDLQKTLESYSVSIPRVSIYPSTIIPFLDSQVPNEALVKVFLRSVSNVHIFALPNSEIYDAIIAKAMECDYDRLVELQQVGHHTTLFIDKASDQTIHSIVLLTCVEGSFYYCVYATGNMNEQDVRNLANLEPYFYENYFRRFNIRF